MALNQELLKILACPKCKKELEPTPAWDGLICRTCGVVYRIEDEIPIMLVEEAVPLKDFEAGSER
jgi:hypothetical protein